MQGFRTYIVAALVAIFGALATIDWNPVFNDPKAGWTAVVTAVIMAVMRSFTTPPPASKG